LYFAQVQSVNDTSAYTLVPFVVRPSFSRLGLRPIAVVLPEYTYQAYNPWGNASLYICQPNGCGPFPTISFNRPYAGTINNQPKASGTNRFSDADSYIVDFLTNSQFFGNNFQADYFLSSDLDLNPSALSYYNMFISIFHDEYWTDQVWNAYRAAILNVNNIKGVNAVFLSGNTAFWKQKWNSKARQLTIYKVRQYRDCAPWPPPPVDWSQGQDQTGLWWNGAVDSQHPLPSYVPGMWIGGGPMGGAPWTNPHMPLNAYVMNQNHWVFSGQGVPNGQNTGLQPGQLFGSDPNSGTCVIGWETDAVQFTLNGNTATPTGTDGAGSQYPGVTKILAWANLNNWSELSYIGTYMSPPSSIAQATLSILEPTGQGTGSVFMAGSNFWSVYGISRFNPVFSLAAVGKITANVINKFSH
jgi:hypothetical protein